MLPFDHLISSLEKHAQDYPAEQWACELTARWLRQHWEFAFVKNNTLWHITASLLVINTERTRVLLMFHKKLQMWVQFGGHCDGETDTLWVAIREFHEESGITLEPVVYPGIFCVDVHTIPPYRDTAKHRHYDIMYLAHIPWDTPFLRQESEVDDIRWFDIDTLEQTLGEKWMINRIAKITPFLANI